MLVIYKKQELTTYAGIPRPAIYRMPPVGRSHREGTGAPHSVNGNQGMSVVVRWGSADFPGVIPCSNTTKQEN